MLKNLSLGSCITWRCTVVIDYTPIECRAGETVVNPVEFNIFRIMHFLVITNAKNHAPRNCTSQHFLPPLKGLYSHFDVAEYIQVFKGKVVVKIILHTWR
jgi:hypothetical protein